MRDGRAMGAVDLGPASWRMDKELIGARMATSQRWRRRYGEFASGVPWMKFGIAFDGSTYIPLGLFFSFEARLPFPRPVPFRLLQYLFPCCRLPPAILLLV